MPPAPKAILIDMDDTILAFDYGVNLNTCWKNVCGRHLPELDDQSIDEMITVIREKAKWFWSDPNRHRTGRLDMDKARTEIVTSAFRELQITVLRPELAVRIAHEYGVAREKAVSAYPRALETLEELRSLGIKLALLTNGSISTQRKKIERFNLAPYFDCILIEEEFGAGKPDDRVYLHALNELGVLPEETWMIGDNLEWEVIAPQKLGIKGVWINPAGKEPRQGVQPFKTIETLSDILRFLHT